MNLTEFSNLVNTMYFGDGDETNSIQKNRNYKYQQQFSHISEKIYKEKLNPLVQEDIFLHHYKELISPILDIFREIANDNSLIYLNLQRDICRFNTYRAFWHTKYLVELIDKAKDLESFSEECLTINNLFNKKWIELELATIRSIIYKTRSYLKDEISTHIYPNLELRVSSQNAKEDDLLIIRPFNDPFWNTFYPPNDFNRLDVVQLNHDENLTLQFPSLNLNPALGHNSALTGRIFTEEHIYYQLDPLKKQEIDKLSDQLFVKYAKERLAPEPKTPYTVSINPQKIVEPKVSIWGKIGKIFS
ncbi:hypothetical protein [Dyadobacter frigoris]|uniref:DUF4238 domain-containing protein n=1 Tax=Dyadobacter frigoris TaxID=2576211 RepID=A0A4U6CXH4_9BACT|nr:hypothetical protein [Dyadobacter frigoris]TKT89509.1 hypothetical protein FDK13_24510 [Dyadobacter frigoris]